LGEVGYNSAMAIAPASLPVFYNKVKLMPFTEYAPPPPLGEWLQVLGVSRRSLQTGVYPYAVRLSSEPPVGVLICYESLFGWISAKQVCDGAQWLVAMTNDQWLLGAGVREQHADYCVLRAIETRRWVVRASTVGSTGFFSPLGERRTISIGRPEVAVHTIECFSGMTLYSRWGDFLGYGSLLVFASILLWGRLGIPRYPVSMRSYTNRAAKVHKNEYAR
jgi:apolipoprotein N-acyltransferase